MKSTGNLWRKIERTLHLDELAPPVRRVLVVVVGGTLLLAGVAMIVLPGPAIVAIPLGLLVLGTEFAWARRSLKKARGLLKHTKKFLAE
jgi:hypothetical protein